MLYLILGWMIYKPRNMILYNYEIPTLIYYDPETGGKKVSLISDIPYY